MFCIGGGGVRFGPFLYRGSNFGHFSMKGSKHENMSFCCIACLKNDTILYERSFEYHSLYRSLENVICLFRGFSKMPFCCIVGSENVIFRIRGLEMAILLYRRHRKCHSLYRGCLESCQNFIPSPTPFLNGIALSLSLIVLKL